MTAPTVYIIDDDAAVRESLAALVSMRGLAVESFGSAEEFLAAGRLESAGCVVADVRMGGMSGLELLARLANEPIPLPVVVITGHGNVPLAVRAMQQGAVTFLEKPCPDSELWKAIEAALAQGAAQRAAAEKSRALAARFKSLSPGESAVLARVLAGRPNKRIAAELDIGLRTVELRRANILRKLGTDSLAEVVRMALVAGFDAARLLAEVSPQ